MKEQSNQSFTELEVWKQARSFKNEVKELTITFPSDERFRLTDQIIRSSRSINAVIAEGHGRYTSKDQLHFCIIARGSLRIDAFDCNYITREQLIYYKNLIDNVGKLLNGYITYLRKSV